MHVVAAMQAWPKGPPAPLARLWLKGWHKLLQIGKCPMVSPVSSCCATCACGQTVGVHMMFNVALCDSTTWF